MIVFDTSRSLQPSARLGDIRLHSAYNPRLEAERFLERTIGNREAPLFILCGPCLDYLSPFIRARCPRSKILSIQYSAAFRGQEIADPSQFAGLQASWYPDDVIPLSSFLNNNIDEDLVSGLVYLEWSPAARAFPVESARTNSEIAVVLEKLAASAATLKAFGRLWFANSCRGFLLLESILEPSRMEVPVVVAAAGPSLGPSLDDLRPFRDRFRLIAVSSSLASCLAHGLSPDLVVSTDGGFWSRSHLYPLMRRSLPLAAPLSALPSACLSGRIPLVLIEQDGFPEKELAAALGGGMPLPSHGTVAGTALRIAVRLGLGPIVAAGYDFANFDLSSHTSPHGFDSFLVGKTQRLSPRESILYGRETDQVAQRINGGPWRSSRSLMTYAEALSRESHEFGVPLYRLRPSPVPLDGFATIEAGELEGLLSPTPIPCLSFSERKIMPAAQRRIFLRLFLESVREATVFQAERLGKSIIPDNPRVIELFKAMDLPDWAAARRLISEGKDPETLAKAIAASTLSRLDGIKESLLS